MSLLVRDRKINLISFLLIMTIPNQNEIRIEFGIIAGRNNSEDLHIKSKRTNKSFSYFTSLLQSRITIPIIIKYGLITAKKMI